MDKQSRCKFVPYVVVALLGLQSVVFAQPSSPDWPSHQEYTLMSPRGTYLLDFDKIYTTVASLDVETVVSLPPGYTFSLNRAGSVDYISAFVLQNELFFTRTIDHKISTSLVCNVVTPTGEVKNLVFKITGGPGEPVVYAIHFKVVEEPATEDVVVEKDCTPEIEVAVSKRERELNEEIYHNTMIDAMPAFFNHHRDGMKKSYKGATAYINGVIFTRGEAFVYINSNVKKDACDIIKLLKIKQGQNELLVDLVDTHEALDGSWAYVYKAPLQQPKRGKRTKISFVFEIWSQILTYTAIIS